MARRDGRLRLGPSSPAPAPMPAAGATGRTPTPRSTSSATGTTPRPWSAGASMRCSSTTTWQWASWTRVCCAAAPTACAGTPTLLPALAVTTRHIGLIATANTSYNEPYTIARKFASLDHLSGGRAGWNLVTALIGGENFNRAEHLQHADATRAPGSSSRWSPGSGTAGRTTPSPGQGLRHLAGTGAHARAGPRRRALPRAWPVECTPAAARLAGDRPGRLRSRPRPGGAHRRAGVHRPADPGGGQGLPCRYPPAPGVGRARGG